MESCPTVCTHWSEQHIPHERSLRHGDRVNGQRPIVPACRETLAVGRKLERHDPVGLGGQRLDFGQIVSFENLDRLVGRGRDQRLAIRRPGQPQDRVFVSDEGIEQLPFPITERPDANGLVEPAGRDHFS